MISVSPSDLYRAKADRRKRLAALPVDEKVSIMEKLQDMGHALRAARKTMQAADRTRGEQG